MNFVFGSGLVLLGFREYMFRILVTVYRCEGSDTSLRQGVTERCRLSWLTYSDLVYEPKCGEDRAGRGGGCGVSANEYSCACEAQINIGNLTPYITYPMLLLDIASYLAWVVSI
jgi:hypothetical protein